MMGDAHLQCKLITVRTTNHRVPNHQRSLLDFPRKDVRNYMEKLVKSPLFRTYKDISPSKKLMQP